MTKIEQITKIAGGKCVTPGYGKLTKSTMRVLDSIHLNKGEVLELAKVYGAVRAHWLMSKGEDEDEGLELRYTKVVDYLEEVGAIPQVWKRDFCAWNEMRMNEVMSEGQGKANERKTDVVVDDLYSESELLAKYTKVVRDVEKEVAEMKAPLDVVKVNLVYTKYMDVTSMPDKGRLFRKGGFADYDNVWGDFASEVMNRGIPLCVSKISAHVGWGKVTITLTIEEGKDYDKGVGNIGPDFLELITKGLGRVLDARDRKISQRDLMKEDAKYDNDVGGEGYDKDVGGKDVEAKVEARGAGEKIENSKEIDADEIDYRQNCREILIKAHDALNRDVIMCTNGKNICNTKYVKIENKYMGVIVYEKDEEDEEEADYGRYGDNYGDMIVMYNDDDSIKDEYCVERYERQFAMYMLMRFYKKI